MATKSTASKEVVVNGIKIGGGNPVILIAGPCVIESETHVLKTAEQLKIIAKDVDIPLIFKSSYDTANRSSLKNFRGPGLDKGLKILQKIKRELDLAVLSDIHKEEEAGPAGEVLDILQIPAFLCRQTDLLLAAARTGKPVNVKKGQFMAPWDMKNVVAKITGAGNSNVMVCERGVSFGYNTLLSDMRSLPELAATGCPVVYDATHSVQQPGGQGTVSGGQREFVPVLARAAVAVGVAAVFMETHPDPDNAPSDGPNMVPMKDMPALLDRLTAFDKLAKENIS